MPLVTGVLVMTGGSFVFDTVTVNDCCADAVPSLTLSVTECGPTSSLSGVPDSVAVPFPLSVRASQPGRVGAVMVSAGPSGSAVEIA